MVDAVFWQLLRQSPMSDPEVVVRDTGKQVMQRVVPQAQRANEFRQPVA
jgi:hypothetical protein